MKRGLDASGLAAAVDEYLARELAGGSFAIDSHSPGGTVVGFHLPLGS